VHLTHTNATIHFDSTIFIMLPGRFEAIEIIDWLNRVIVGFARFFTFCASILVACSVQHTMSLPPDTERTIQQPMDCTMQDTGAGIDDTSVAAAAADLQALAASSSSGQSHV
jgi:hypothetical protein